MICSARRRISASVSGGLVLIRGLANYSGSAARVFADVLMICLYMANKKRRQIILTMKQVEAEIASMTVELHFPSSEPIGTGYVVSVGSHGTDLRYTVESVRRDGDRSVATLALVPSKTKRGGAGAGGDAITDFVKRNESVLQLPKKKARRDS